MKTEKENEKTENFFSSYMELYGELVGQSPFERCQSIFWKKKIKRKRKNIISMEKMYTRLIAAMNEF